MRPGFSSAFFLSVILHGAVVVFFLIFVYLVHEQTKEQPRIFELVAGEGDNHAATAAPALGVANPVKLNVPAPEVRPAVKIAPPEPEPAPQPVIERAPEKTPPKAEPKPAESKIPNFTKDVKRIADKREKNLTEKDRKAREAAEKKAREEEARKKTMTKEEFDRLNKGKPQPKAATTPPKVAKIDAEGIAKGVIGGSTANKTAGAGGKALTKEEQSLLDSYIALLLQRLRAAHEKPPGLSDLLRARVQFRIAADGTMSGVKIIESSGSSEFDRSVLEAFARVRSIGATPDRKSDVWTVTFKMTDED